MSVKSVRGKGKEGLRLDEKAILTTERSAGRPFPGQSTDMRSCDKGKIECGLRMAC